MYEDQLTVKSEMSVPTLSDYSRTGVLDLAVIFRRLPAYQMLALYFRARREQLDLICWWPLLRTICLWINTETGGNWQLLVNHNIFK